MAKKVPDVWHEPFLLSNRISQILDDFFRDFDQIGFEIAPSFGRTDIYEKDKNLVFETELPGVKKNEIKIKVEGDRLVISGETKRNEEVREENYFRIGRHYGRFQYTFPLPADIIDKNGIKASIQDGILKVIVPLKESLKEKEKPIEVKVE